MDWSQLRQNIDKLAKTGMEASSKAMDISQEYIKQAAAYSREKLRASTIYIHDTSQFDSFLKEKRGVLVCVRTGTPESEKLLLEIPVFYTKAWVDIATFRVMEYPADPEEKLIFGESINIDTFPTTLLFFEGKEIKREARLIPMSEIPNFIQF